MPKKKPPCPNATPQANAAAVAPVKPCPGPNPQVVKRGHTTLSVDRQAKTITMTGTQEYSGTGASQAYSDRATSDINNTWSGPTTFEGQPYTVTSNITGKYLPPGTAPDPDTNQINVVQTNDPPSVTSQNDPSNQSFYGAGPGHQHSTDDTHGTVIAPHEFGHSMGLLDEYTEGPHNADGTRSIVQTGPAGGLMGHIDSGSKPTPANFNSLITGCGLK